MRRPSINLPNLGLLLYQAHQLWLKDENNSKNAKQAEMRVYVFPQIWGSTCLGFAQAETGEPTMGGCAMTEAYTTVVRETSTKTYFVFFDGRICYMVSDPSEAFYEDLKNHALKSFSEAKKAY